MKIVHLSTYDDGGGAIRSCWRLHAGLVRLGLDSSLFVKRKFGTDPFVKGIEPDSGMVPRLFHRLSKKNARRRLKPYRETMLKGYSFSDERSDLARETAAQLPSAELYNLHWVAGMIDFPTLFRAIPMQTPMVWTLHDMNPFTGGCHYDLMCGKYTQRCGACPMLGSTQNNDLSTEIFQVKQAVLDKIPSERIKLITPSRWLAHEVRRSALFKKFTVETIPYGIDTEAFAPRDKAHARSVLGIPPKARVVLFAAAGLHFTIKGFGLLCQALSALKARGGFDDLVLVSMGREKPEQTLPFPHIHLGYVEHERLLSLIYSSADVYAISSLQDNLPNVVLEAMACGVPVAGFEVGGIPDMVRTNGAQATGRLAPAGDTVGLAEVIAQLLNMTEPARAAMGVEARKVALAEYTLEVQALRYQTLYERLLSAPASN